MCIEKAPEGHKDLKGKEGKVVSLVPKACIPLEYNIKIGKEEIILPFTSVKILDYEDDRAEIDPEEVDPMLKVNGLCYCKNHRLETCHQCGYDFLCENLGAELRNDTDDAMEGSFSIRHRLAEELKAAGAPVRTAPLKNIECNSASEAIDAVIGMIPEGTNFLSLQEVPTGVSLYSAFDKQFGTIVNGETGWEYGPKGGLYKVRTTFCSIANCVDRAKRESREIPRICLQDESRITKSFSFDGLMDGLIIDVIDARMMDSHSPVLILAMSRSEDLAASTNGIFKDGFQIEVFRMKPNEIDLFVKIVQGNATRLSNSEDDFVFKGVKILNTCCLMPCLPREDYSVFKIGVAIPITSTESKRYHELHGKYCGFCGASDCKLFKCSGCKNVLYCGRSCQKSDRKMHKLVCCASRK